MSYGTPDVVGHFVGINAAGARSLATLANNTMWLNPGTLHWRHYTTNGLTIDG